MAQNESIGALWKNEGKNGTYLSGNVEIDGRKVPIVIFPNTYKKPGEKTPDYRILPKKQKSDTYVQPGSPADDHANGRDAFGGDDIPFENENGLAF